MSQLDPSRYLRLTGSRVYGQSDGLFWDTTSQRLVVVIGGTIVGELTTASPTAGKALVGDGSKLTALLLSGDVSVDAAGAVSVNSVHAASVGNTGLAKPRIRVVKETVTAASLTDGLGAVGTKDLTTQIPAGALVLACLTSGIVGFAGDVSAAITVGDGSDVDRYMTGTPNVFATAAAGVAMGAVSGTAFHSAAKTPTVTITSNTDITPVIAGAGSVDVTLVYVEPV